MTELPENELRVGLIGAGGIAQSYIRVFEAITGARITAVADVRSRAADCDRRRGARARRTRRTARCSRKPTSTRCSSAPRRSTHPEIVLQAIEQRPPRAVREAARDRRAQRARRWSPPPSAPASSSRWRAKFRFVDDVIRAHQIVRSGILGELIVVENSFASRVDMSRRWNSDPAIAGGGVLIDNGTHSVDIVRYFLGPIAEVMAVEGKRVQHLAVEDTASMLLRTPDGALGTVDLSWSVDRVDGHVPHGLRIAGHDQRRMEGRARTGRHRARSGSSSAVATTRSPAWARRSRTSAPRSATRSRSRSLRTTRSHRSR